MAKIGTIKCLCCGQELPVKENDNGALNLSCPWCDLSAYAKKGTQAHKLLAPKVKRDEAPAAAAPAAVVAAAPAADKAAAGKGKYGY